MLRNDITFSERVELVDMTNNFNSSQRKITEVSTKNLNSLSFDGRGKITIRATYKRQSSKVFPKTETWRERNYLLKIEWSPL